VNVAEASSVALQPLAITGAQVPGEPAGHVFAKFGPPSAGPFWGRMKAGLQIWAAIFTAMDPSASEPEIPLLESLAQSCRPSALRAVMPRSLLW
jgi:hypothetical protein